MRFEVDRICFRLGAYAWLRARLICSLRQCQWLLDQVCFDRIAVVFGQGCCPDDRGSPRYVDIFDGICDLY